jgi:hypothetical protein
MKLFALPVIDPALYAAAYATFHAPTHLVPPVVAGFEYVMALHDTIAEGVAPRNVSLLALEHMTPAVADFSLYGDFRHFAPSPEFTAAVAAHVIEIIGVTHWFDTSAAL